MYDALGYFEILGADLYTNPETLKLLYHEKAKFWHPDVNQRLDALENFQKLSKAYDMLKNEQFKTAYVLLSMIYKKNDFPSFERLKVYLDAKGFETPFLRVFHIQKIIRKKVETSRLVGTFEDALDFLKKTTFENIKNGLFCRLFIPTLKHNLGAINTDVSDNFKLLIHNAATFYLQGKLQNAYLSALQAKDYASSEQKAVLDAFIKKLPHSDAKLQKWDFKKLRAVQLAPFMRTVQIFGGVLSVVVILLFVRLLSLPANKKVDYYQEVHFTSGDEMADDTVALKVFNIPVDKTDVKMLYHITSSQNIMHGPNEKYDILIKAREGQTVRVTGYTPDDVWYRIMLDNGQMGFIRKQYLKKGIGLDIAPDSRIIEH